MVHDRSAVFITNMLSLRKSDVPDYLCKSAFYLSLSTADTDDEFAVPVECFKANITVTNEHNFRNLLSTVRFWGVVVDPNVICKASFDIDFFTLDALCNDFGRELWYLRAIRAIRKQDKPYWLEEAARWGNLAIIHYMMQKAVEKWDIQSACVVAAQYGHRGCLEYLQGFAGKIPSYGLIEVCEAAATYGSYECFVFGYSEHASAEVKKRYLRGAIACGNAEIVKLLLNKGLTLRQKDICKVGTAAGVQLIHDLGLYDWSKHDMLTSVEHLTFAGIEKMEELGCKVRLSDEEFDLKCNMFTLVVIAVFLLYCLLLGVPSLLIPECPCRHKYMNATTNAAYIIP